MAGITRYFGEIVLNGKARKAVTTKVYDEYSQAVRRLRQEGALEQLGAEIKLKTKGWFTTQDLVQLTYKDKGEILKHQLPARAPGKSAYEYLKEAIDKAKKIKPEHIRNGMVNSKSYDRYYDAMGSETTQELMGNLPEKAKVDIKRDWLTGHKKAYTAVPTPDGKTVFTQTLTKGRGKRESIETFMERAQRHANNVNENALNLRGQFSPYGVKQTVETAEQSVKRDMEADLAQIRQVPQTAHSQEEAETLLNQKLGTPNEEDMAAWFEHGTALPQGIGQIPERALSVPVMAKGQLETFFKPEKLVQGRKPFNLAQFQQDAIERMTTTTRQHVETANREADAAWEAVQAKLPRQAGESVDAHQVPSPVTASAEGVDLGAATRGKKTPPPPPPQTSPLPQTSSSPLGRSEETLSQSGIEGRKTPPPTQELSSRANGGGGSSPQFHREDSEFLDLGHPHGATSGQKVPSSPPGKKVSFNADVERHDVDLLSREFDNGVATSSQRTPSGILQDAKRGSDAAPQVTEAHPKAAPKSNIGGQQAGLEQQERSAVGETLEQHQAGSFSGDVHEVSALKHGQDKRSSSPPPESSSSKPAGQHQSGSDLLGEEDLDEAFGIRPPSGQQTVRAGSPSQQQSAFKAVEQPSLSKQDLAKYLEYGQTLEQRLAAKRTVEITIGQAQGAQAALDQLTKEVAELKQVRETLRQQNPVWDQAATDMQRVGRGHIVRNKIEKPLHLFKENEQTISGIQKQSIPAFESQMRDLTQQNGVIQQELDAKRQWLQDNPDAFKALRRKAEQDIQQLEQRQQQIHAEYRQIVDKKHESEDAVKQAQQVQARLRAYVEKHVVPARSSSFESVSVPPSKQPSVKAPVAHSNGNAGETVVENLRASTPDMSSRSLPAQQGSTRQMAPNSVSTQPVTSLDHTASELRPRIQKDARSLPSSTRPFAGQNSESMVEPRPKSPVAVAQPDVKVAPSSSTSSSLPSRESSTGPVKQVVTVEIQPQPTKKPSWGKQAMQTVKGWFGGKTESKL